MNSNGRNKKLVGCVWIVRLCYCGFEPAGATLSPTRISHRSGRHGNLHLLTQHTHTHKKGRPERHIPRCDVYVYMVSLIVWKCVSVCVSMYYIFSLSLRLIWWLFKVLVLSVGWCRNVFIIYQSDHGGVRKEALYTVSLILYRGSLIPCQITHTLSLSCLCLGLLRPSSCTQKYHPSLLPSFPSLLSFPLCSFPSPPLFPFP